MLAVIVSERAQRTVLSVSVMFLVFGFLLGRGALGWLDLSLEGPLVSRFAELALFGILFVDGSDLPLGELANAWRLPGRALLLGMPLTLGVIAVAGHWLLGMTWQEGILVGAILSPTDPVLVAEILQHESVPLRLRRLLAVESGLNDGLALPVVVTMLALSGNREVQALRAGVELLSGVAIGVAVPVLFLAVERLPVFAATRDFRPPAGLAIACVILGSSRLLSANEFLAAFAGGVTLATMNGEFARSLRCVGLPVAEALKLATLLVFGAVLTLPLLGGSGWAGLAFAAAVIVVARPLALLLSMVGGGLSRGEWLAAAWFGPKGFASLLYALIMRSAGIERGTMLFQAVALVIVLSVLLHSSTDVPVARVFRRREERG